MRCLFRALRSALTPGALVAGSHTSTSANPIFDSAATTGSGSMPSASRTLTSCTPTVLRRNAFRDSDGRAANVAKTPKRFRRFMRVDYTVAPILWDKPSQ